MIDGLLMVSSYVSLCACRVEFWKLLMWSRMLKDEEFQDDSEEDWMDDDDDEESGMRGQPFVEIGFSRNTAWKQMSNRSRGFPVLKK